MSFLHVTWSFFNVFPSCHMASAFLFIALCVRHLHQRLLLSHILSMSFPAYCSPSCSGSSCTPFLNKSVGDQLVYLQCLSFISLGLGVLNHRLVHQPPLTLNVAFDSLLAF
ncbi:hypothetical protein JB92DRAFT_2994135 [Gautieria morchelliformis]|nr:hypothetical protein JB92DRAFT_2994135 [Gautieria morchelliformis]